MKGIDKTKYNMKKNNNYNNINTMKLIKNDQQFLASQKKH